MARFQREAEVLASLNHPNIAQIYGVEDRALVMELVEGETLKGPLPLETALNYAKQIAEALEAAHERGIVHRDLKPANIKITPAGVVKVLDFGLAKASRRTVLVDPQNSPTMTISPTRAGMILGTAAYMSPEQARGKTSRQARRYLGLRLRALRDAYGTASFHGRDDHRRTRGGSEERAGLECSSAEGAAAARIVLAEGPEAAAASYWRLSIAAGRSRRLAACPHGRGSVGPWRRHWRWHSESRAPVGGARRGQWSARSCG